MSTTDKRFSTKEKALLKALEGKTLNSLNACIVARGDMAWNTVRLHCNNCSIDVNNHLGEIIVDEFGTVDEFGLMSVTEADSSTLSIEGASPETTVILIEKEIRSIRVIDDLIKVFGNDKLVAEIKYPQAVAFDLGDEVLVLDKETWFEETLSIKAGKDLAEIIYDDTVNWVDDPKEDPTTHYETCSEITIL